MAGLNSIGLFVPDWLALCGQKGQPTCAEAAEAYKKMSEAAAKKAVAPAFAGTPASVPSTSTAATNNSAARFQDCDIIKFGGRTTCL